MYLLVYGLEYRMTSCELREMDFSKLRVHLGRVPGEYRTGIWYRLVPGTVEVLSRYCSDPVLRFAVAIATAIFPTCDMALNLVSTYSCTAVPWYPKRLYPDSGQKVE